MTVNLKTLLKKIEKKSGKQKAEGKKNYVKVNNHFQHSWKLSKKEKRPKLNLSWLNREKTKIEKF